MEIIMKLLGSLANCGTVIVGSVCGMLFKKGIPKKLEDMIMKAIGLSVMFIGISGLKNGKNTIVLIFSMVLGTIIGTLLRLDDRVNSLGRWAERHFSKSDDSSNSGNFAKGMVTAMLIFCVGAMTVVGSLDSGLRLDHSTLYSKAVLDGIMSVVLASTYGVGVLFSIFPLLLYQGSITLLAGLVAPLLSNIIVGEMTAVGSLLILALGMNIAKITDIKIMNMLPAMFLPILIYQIPLL